MEDKVYQFRIAASISNALPAASKAPEDSILLKAFEALAKSITVGLAGKTLRVLGLTPYGPEEK